ncbi:PD-(D/E)XK motif protein [Psychrobacillus sp. FSL H8-0510]|uniref:PD-(D/E)XK motif protein n=1 Tax=Psychrobacillus sp. FSL H8-0510 TaxID=2921394 RepID=UPI0030F88ECF
MININEAFNNLLESMESGDNHQLHQSQIISHNDPYILIGINVQTSEKQLFIDVTQETWRDKDVDAFPKWKGLSIEVKYFEQLGFFSKKRFLVISQKVESSEEIFEAVLQNLVENMETNEGTSLFNLIYRVLDRWNQFFTKDRKAKLNREQQIGLFGELSYIHEAINRYPLAASGIVDSWKGPMGNRVDFSLGSYGIEVKTISLKLRSQEVHISNEKQLELNELIKTIYLYVIEIEENDVNGSTLNDIIEEIRQVLCELDSASLANFNNKLIELGIVETIYDDKYFVKTDEAVYSVKENFPCITSNMLPAGVTNVSYTLNLSLCKPFKVSSTELYSVNKEG